MEDDFSVNIEEICFDPENQADGSNPASHQNWSTTPPIASGEQVPWTINASDVIDGQRNGSLLPSHLMAPKYIIDSFCDSSISDESMFYDTIIHGWNKDHTMSIYDIRDQLELYGVGSHVKMDASIEDLMSELTQGRRVIISKSSEIIEEPGHPLWRFFQQSSGNAIWIDKVDLSDPGHPKITIKDSFDPQGPGKEYELAEFVNAWRDSGLNFVATDHAPPDTHLTANDFDQEKGMFLGLSSYFTEMVGQFPPTSSKEEPSLQVDSSHEASAKTTSQNLTEDMPVNPISRLSDEEKEELFKLI